MDPNVFETQELPRTVPDEIIELRSGLPNTEVGFD